METIFQRKVDEINKPLREYLKRKNDLIVAERKAEEKRISDHEKWLAHKRLENQTRPLNFQRKEKIKDMLKVLNGLPPYDGGTNICYGDGYYSRSIPGREGDKEYDTAMEELEKEFGSVNTWSRFWNKNGGRW